MKLAGLHHIAICTSDMKAQIEFFTQVVGMKLVGLFPMHGAPGAFHCFMEMGEDSYMSFVRIPGVDIKGIVGVSHAADAVSPVAAGAMQHIAINVKSQADLRALRDHIRSKNYAVVGPLNHGTSESLYLSAPEGILLEFSSPEDSLPWDPEVWIDPDVVGRCEMTPEDIIRYQNPPTIEAASSPVPQPDPAVAVPPTPIPPPMFAAMTGMSDDDIRTSFNFPLPNAPKQPA